MKPMHRPALFLCFVLIFSLFSQEICTDGTCSLPNSARTAEITVLTPLPAGTVPNIRQGARLTTLHGKTIAIVGGSFMAHITHPELKRLILKEYPSAKIYLLNEIGSAGPYPRPGIIRQSTEDFRKRLQEFHIDAVISGNGGCGLCTPKETGSCIVAERLGLPSVMIAGPGFSRQAKETAAAAGVPLLRVAEYPGAFASHDRETLLKNTREILWPQIRQALLTPMTKEELAVAGTRQQHALQITGSPEELQQIFLESGWTDGLPVILPTANAVAEFLQFTEKSPDQSLGAIPPGQREITVRHIAIHGVMAGCPPEFMPLLLALTEAMKNGNFRRPLSSTHGWTPYCWLNGPIARQLGFENGQGEISAAKNMQLGRFLQLALQNLAGYEIQKNRMGTFGYLTPWCLVENEEAALRCGWLPYHVQCGYRLEDSTLTAASALNWGNNLAPASSHPQTVKNLIAWDAAEKQQLALGSGMPRVYRTFLLTPATAELLSRAYPSKDALEAALRKTARVPLAARAYANYYANPGSSFDPHRYSLEEHQKKLFRKELGTLTAPPPWLQWIGDKELETVPVMQKGKNAFLITGDPMRNKELCLPGGAPVTLKIQLPANWDQLMQKRGYAPLQSFYLR